MSSTRRMAPRVTRRGLLRLAVIGSLSSASAVAIAPPERVEIVDWRGWVLRSNDLSINDRA
jgi:hypothetical protein